MWPFHPTQLHRGFHGVGAAGHGQLAVVERFLAGRAHGQWVEIGAAGAPSSFSVFWEMEHGPTMRLAGIPIGSKFHLVGNAVIARGLFRYSAAAGLGAPVRVCFSQRDGEQTRIDLASTSTRPSPPGRRLKRKPPK
jgi:hypothetical protein